MYEALSYYCILYQDAYIVRREGMRGKKKRGRKKTEKEKGPSCGEKRRMLI